MRNLYEHHFDLKPGTRVYVPTDHGRERGQAIKTLIEGRWKVPDYYYHLQPGGHVAAARLHRDASWVTSVDLQRFFDQITRQKVHRSLKRLHFSHAEAWEMSCDSTVDKKPPRRRFSIPFGFVQSPILSSIVLSHSGLGKAIADLHRKGVAISVYMDDITLSGDNEAAVSDALEQVNRAAETSRFTFNPEKIQPPTSTVTNFNIAFGSGSMQVTEERMDEFKAVFPTKSASGQIGIYTYVRSVDSLQAEDLV
ncbi:reverse transcriptase domain-containing protein [Novosphingobium kaempferiae]|uniref:reverse transcriptase domain-containing protein n=1 Tax=Novosphingobium kaempferiae TaxID=2896849 RepID=UPI001E369A9F|nr:reverse transcriptase domain-containing protein [Novosphingobium kaempferiae]